MPGLLGVVCSAWHEAAGTSRPLYVVPPAWHPQHSTPSMGPQHCTCRRAPDGLQLPQCRFPAPGVPHRCKLSPQCWCLTSGFLFSLTLTPSRSAHCVPLTYTHLAISSKFSVPGIPGSWQPARMQAGPQSGIGVGLSDIACRKLPFLF